MPKRQSRSSTELILIPAEATPATTPILADLVQMAFTVGRDIERATPPSSYQPAEWKTINGQTFASILVGPGSGGIALGRGDFVVWVKVTDSPEIPAVPVDVLTIF